MRASLIVLVWFVAVANVAGQEKKTMKTEIDRSTFGETADGTAVELFQLTNARGARVKIITLGGIITEIHVPDRDGKSANVVLGFDNLKDYLKGHPYFGCITGRVANRVAGAKFTLGGKEYKLAANVGTNSLHGGLKGFDKVVWKAEPLSAALGVRLTRRSPDGEEGYPGNLDTTVTYLWTDDNELKIDYSAVTDQPTPVNLTNHSYFNLTGGKDDILGHELELAADKYTPLDANLMPTGKIETIKDTPLDFTKPATIGSRIKQTGGNPIGYDRNYVIRGGGKKLTFTARAHEPKSGRVLEMFTTEPGVQLYTGNFLDGKLKGYGGVVYRQHMGFCLEAQHFPDALHHATFPSIILEPGKTYRQTTVYRFSTK